MSIRTIIFKPDSMTKILLTTMGVALLGGSAMQAAPEGSFSGGRARAQVRPSANYSRAYQGGARYGYRGYRGGYGHRYYLGGIPYFYDPFFFGFGYGYYGGFYGEPGGYGPYGGYNNGAYNGQVVDDRSRNDDGNPDPSALPKEVQRQLSKRGYYKGSVDGGVRAREQECADPFPEGQRPARHRSSGRGNPQGARV